MLRNVRYRQQRLWYAALAAILAWIAAGGAPLRGAPLPRDKIVLTSAIAVDGSKQTVVLPLHRGRAGVKTVWYVVTDSSSAADSKIRGVLYAPKLAEIEPTCPSCVAHVRQVDGEILFNAAPDFAPTRRFVPGPAGFPPELAEPGATAPDGYSPFVRIDDSAVVLNAPIVATGTGPFDVLAHADTHDRVLTIDTAAMTVTLLLARGYANGKAILYFSTEASDPGVATIERATFVPRLTDAAKGWVAVFATVNGPRDPAGPQGLIFAALDGRLKDDASVANAGALDASMNVFGSFPTGADPESYTPLWSANVGLWRASALAAHTNVLLTSPRQFSDAAERGDLTAPDGKPFGPIGVNVNCPVVAYVDQAP